MTKGFRHGYLVMVYKKAEFEKLVKSRQFQVISEGRSQSAFTYNVRKLDKEMASLMQLAAMDGPGGETGKPGR